jgi:glycine/D-amino acid oxidase-like deaminating enzyme
MKAQSLWLAESESPGFAALSQDLAVDVAIVGAGITGIMAAHRLSSAGMSVAVLESHEVAAGSSGNSTGNLYGVVGAGLALLRKKWGEERTRRVAQARAAAVADVERLVNELSLDCEFQRVPFRMYLPPGASPSEQEDLAKERDAALQAALPATLEDAATLPFRTGTSLVIPGQAQFQPARFVRELARRVARERCAIFEHSQVMEVEAKKGFIRTAAHRVNAGAIVLATHTPKGFNLVQTELGPYREYGIALEAGGVEIPAGIYWSAGASRISLRPFQTGGRGYVVVVGQKHKVGQEDDTERCYRALADFARDKLGSRGSRIGGRRKAITPQTGCRTSAEARFRKTSSSRAASLPTGSPTAPSRPPCWPTRWRGARASTPISSIPPVSTR